MDKTTMTQKELFDALDGLYAYDTGCVDSGIRDPILKEKVRQLLTGLPEDAFRILISTFVREHFLTDEHLEQGYGIEDVRGFIEWMSRHMWIEI